MSSSAPLHAANAPKRSAADARLRRRRRAEQRFRTYGLVAIGAALLILAVLFTSIVMRGSGAFLRSVAALEIHVDPEQSQRVRKALNVELHVLPSSVDRLVGDQGENG